MAFDGIMLQAISSELQNLKGSRIDKIYEPNKNCIIIGMYLAGKNYALQININSKDYGVFLTNYSKPNPYVAPNFCMVLRKYLIGMRIKNFVTSHLERVLTIELEGFDDVDDIISYKLIIELMGKHCNILLVDDNDKIIDCIRHIYPVEDDDKNINILSSKTSKTDTKIDGDMNGKEHNKNENEVSFSVDDNSNVKSDSLIDLKAKTRSLFPHCIYKYPIIDKLDFLEIKDFEEFYQILSDSKIITLDLLAKVISDKWNGISRLFVENAIEVLGIKDITSDSLKKLFEYMECAVLNSNFEFKVFTDRNGELKDFTIIPVTKENEEMFSLNYSLDEFLYRKESVESLKIYRNSLLKLVLEVLKQYQKRLYHMQEKLKECDNMEKYRIYGELITANLYQIENRNVKEISVENYYEENKLITIMLDERYSPSENAKRFYKKYHKLKNTLEIVSIQKEETMKDLDYLESIIYELENCDSLNDLSVIFEEISENQIFEDKLKNSKKKNDKKQKNNKKKNNLSSFNPIKYEIDGYTVFVGRNNTENDKLTMKFANKTDIWFHTKDIHGSHVILKIENNRKPEKETLVKVAKIAAYHSKGKNSSHVPVDYCEVKYVKKPNGAKPGMVIYSHNNTLYVDGDNAFNE